MLTPIFYQSNTIRKMYLTSGLKCGILVATMEINMPTPNKLSPLEALHRLQAIALAGRSDLEASHLEADRVLLALLRWHGDQDVVDAFEAVEKWYA